MRLNRWQMKLAFLTFTLFVFWDAGVALATRALSTSCPPIAHGVRWIGTSPVELIWSLLAMPGSKFNESMRNVEAILSLEGQMVVSTIIGVVLLYKRAIQTVYYPNDTKKDFVENYVRYYNKIPTKTQFYRWAIICIAIILFMLYIWYVITTHAEVCNFDSSFMKMIVNSSAMVMYSLLLGNTLPIIFIVFGLL